MTDTGPRYRIEPDGDGQLTLWDYQPDPWNPHGPVAITTQGEQPPEVWALILATHQPPLDDSPQGRDAFVESRYTARGEEEFGVTRVGASTYEGPARLIGPAPGAPYAGDRVTAPTSRPADLLDAAKRQQLRDLITQGEL